MAEPGSGEGISIHPIKDQIAAAIRKQDKTPRGDSDSLHEASARVARDFRARILTGDNSQDPLAWRLRRVIISHHPQQYSEKFLLEPPDEVQIATGINMVALNHARNAGKDWDDVGVFQGFDSNPYLQENNGEITTLSPSVRNSGYEATALLTSTATAYDAIAAHGVWVEDDELTIERIEGGELQADVHAYAQEQKYEHAQPNTADLLTRQQQEKQDRLKALAVQHRIEAQAEAERQHIERERLRKEEEGHDFEDGLRKYARNREEGINPPDGALSASLIKSAQALMWTHGEDGIRPGRIFADEMLPLIKRLTATRTLTGRYRSSAINEQQMNEHPKQTLETVEKALTQKFIRISTDESGKEVIEIPPEMASGRFEREGELDFPNKPAFGAFRGHSITREASGAILIKPDDNTTFTDLTVTLASPDEELSAELLDKDGNSTGRTITAKPILQAQLTESVQRKLRKNKTEETLLYRTREGLVVVCPGVKAKCYPDDMSAQANITRKPIIYLYPKKKTKIHVELDYKGRLTNTYPQINGNSWDVVANPDGTLQINGKQYKYLFWDGINGEVDWDWSEGFCVNKKDVDTFLEDKMKQVGLNFAEAQDFITYWAPIMKQNEWSLVSFQTEKYEELAKLLIDPNPDTLIRVFMIFKKCEKQTTIQEQKLKRIKRKGFSIVEWGGSNLDEISLLEDKRKIIIPHESHFRITL